MWVGCRWVCGGGGGSDLSVRRVSLHTRRQSMHLIWVPGHPGETPADPGTPSPHKWQGSTLALCLCTGPYQNHASPKQHTVKSITMSYHQLRASVMLSPKQQHWELARPAQQGHRPPGKILHSGVSMVFRTGKTMGIGLCTTKEMSTTWMDSNCGNSADFCTP